MKTIPKTLSLMKTHAATRPGQINLEVITSPIPFSSVDGWLPAVHSFSDETARASANLAAQEQICFLSHSSIGKLWAPVPSHRQTTMCWRFWGKSHSGLIHAELDGPVGRDPCFFASWWSGSWLRFPGHPHCQLWLPLSSKPERGSPPHTVFLSPSCSSLLPAPLLLRVHMMTVNLSSGQR